jgi:hypothetical protein
MTDRELLYEAFAALSERGILAVHEVGFDQGDGFDEVYQLARETIPRPAGYCFYHSQDADTARAGRGLYLAYGTFSGLDSGECFVAAAIIDELKRWNFDVDWNGSAKQRILLPSFRWHTPEGADRWR